MPTSDRFRAPARPRGRGRCPRRVVPGVERGELAEDECRVGDAHGGGLGVRLIAVWRQGADRDVTVGEFHFAGVMGVADGSHDVSVADEIFDYRGVDTSVEAVGGREQDDGIAAAAPGHQPDQDGEGGCAQQ